MKHGDIVAVRRLLDGGLNPNFANKFGWTILILVAGEGNTTLGELLISRGADLNVSTSHDDYPLSPLASAIMSGHVGFVKLLLDHGATPDPRLAGWIKYAALTGKQREAVLSMARRARKKQSD